MLDCHCHLDLYPEPSVVAQRAEAAGVFTISVTNLPSGFEKSRPHVSHHSRIRLGLGLHPLLAEQHISQRESFEALAHQTAFIGEVGLDFSAEGKATADIQVESFAFVLRVLAQEPKFVSIHSRRAEARVLELLKDARRSPVVFHWYSGPSSVLRDAVLDGHYFSINPAMIRSRNGLKIIASLPLDRVLTETDGPFVTLGNRKAEPADVRLVEDGLARVWKVSPMEARSIVASNFRRLIAPLRE
jgi:TatD DNase family protein